MTDEFARIGRKSGVATGQALACTQRYRLNNAGYRHRRAVVLPCADRHGLYACSLQTKSVTSVSAENTNPPDKPLDKLAAALQTRPCGIT